MTRFFAALLALLLGAPAYGQTLDLRDCMNSRYGAGQWTQRTGQGQGSDIGPAITDCLRTIRNTWGRGKLVIPPGLWEMTSPPDKDLLSGSYVEGYGSQASLIVFNNKCLPWGDAAFWWTGAGGYTGGGMRGIGLLLENGLGDTSCYGIILRGNSQFQPDQVEFSDIYMSALGPSYWYENLHIDGSARSAPKGIRVGMFSNMQLFNSRNLSAYIANGVALVLTGVGCWTGKGPTPNTLFIDAASVEMSLRAVWCSGSSAP